MTAERKLITIKIKCPCGKLITSYIREFSSKMEFGYEKCPICKNNQYILIEVIEK